MSAMSHVGSRLRAVGTFHAVSHLWLSGASGATAACHGTPQEAGDVLSPERWSWQLARATSLRSVRAATERAAGLLPADRPMTVARSRIVATIWVSVGSSPRSLATCVKRSMQSACTMDTRTISASSSRLITVIACGVIRLPYGVVPDVGKARRQRSLRPLKLQRRMHMPMPKFLLPLVGMLLMMAAALIVTHRAEAAAVSTAATNLRAAIGNTSAVEEVRCWRRRVCGPRGCAWRTTCRRRW